MSIDRTLEFGWPIIIRLDQVQLDDNATLSNMDNYGEKKRR